VYLGLAVSVLLHTGLLAWALVSIHSARDVSMPTTPSVAVEFVTPSDVNKMRQGARQAKLKDAQPKDNPAEQPLKETAKPKPINTPPPASEPPPKEEVKAKDEPKPVEKKLVEPPAPKVEPKTEPDKAALEKKVAELIKEPPPGPTPEELKKIEDDALAERLKKQETERKADEERKAEEKRKADEKKAEEDRKQEEIKKEELRKAEEHRKAEEKRKADEKRKAEQKRIADKKKADEKKRREAEAKAKLDLDRLSALIDKSEPKSAPAGAQSDVPTKAKGPVVGDREGRDHTISATEASLLAGLMRQAVSRCWNINAGLDGIDRIVVKVQVRLTRDGRLAAPPRVVNSAPSPLFRDAADSAVRALVQCEPYDLPADKYEGGWEFMELSFDPARMF
jgi:colicin import membrane protein